MMIFLICIRTGGSMKKILLITFLYPMFLLNAMEQKSDKYGSFFKIFYDFKKIGEH